ncbi:EpsG family protein [Vibrio hyugaensis]|uniref:EpsG family protein n=1 Tax=Vibrio hyugaensis TaxID=1534743 RepID=UPI0034E4BB75
MDVFCLITLFIVASIFIGGRYNGGADFIAYTKHYYHDNSEIMNFELGFEYLFYLIRDLGFSFNHASLIIFVVNIGFFVFAIKELKYKTLSLFIFILYFFIPLTAVIRQGLSIPFMALAIINVRNSHKYFFYTIVAAFFHISSLIMIPLFFVRRIKLSRAMFAISISVCFVIGYTNPIEIIISSLSGLNSHYVTRIMIYSTDYTDPMSLTAQLYRLAALGVLFFIWNEIQEDDELHFSGNIYLCVFLLTLLFKDNGVLINRISFSTNISFLYIMLNYWVVVKCESKKIILFLFILMYFPVNYFKFVSTETRFTDKAYLPYQNFIFNDANKYEY